MNKKSLLLVLLLLPTVLYHCKTGDKNTVNLSIIKSALDPEYPFSVNSDLYNDNRSSMPIGVFDSGTGGLAVLEAILTLDEFNNETHLPGSDSIPDFISEAFIYLADEANMPYGRYDAEGKAEFLRELVVKDVIFLAGSKYYPSPDDKEARKDKAPVKEIVIACNTATAYGLETVKEATKEWDLPLNITGIIEAGAQSALAIIKEKEIKKPLIAVFATEGTCSSGGYPRTIMERAEKEHPDAGVEVVQRAGIGLAGAIDGDINYLDPDARGPRPQSEYYGPGLKNKAYPLLSSSFNDYNFAGGNELLIHIGPEGDTLEVQLNSVRNYVRYMVSGLVQDVEENYPDRSIDIVILGCTHYPYVEDEIRKHFSYLRKQESYSDIIADTIIFIDPSKSLARILYTNLVRDDLIGNKSVEDSKFYISVPNKDLDENMINEDFEFPFEWKYGRSENTGLQYVKIVPFSDRVIDPEIMQRIKDQLPETYKLIK